MRKIYYMTILATLAIFYLQGKYIDNLYKQYINENVIRINNLFQISIDRTRYLRKSSDYKVPKPKFAEDMTQQEIDSLNLISSEVDTLNLEDARSKGIAKTSGELFNLYFQDISMEKGYWLKLPVLDSIFTADLNEPFTHCFYTYNKDKQATDSTSVATQMNYSYVSELIPIGTKGLQYVQIKVEIPMSGFVRNMLWILLSSITIMAIVLMCLGYQLHVIRNKDLLLLKRESGINGTIHDLKSPLNSVITMLSWLRKTENNQDRKELIEDNMKGISHLVSKIESLLITASKDKHKIILNKTDIQILPLVNFIKKELSALYHTKPHIIHIDNHLPEGVALKADAMYIENVIRNLVENSLKYSDDGVEITVKLQKTGKMVEISVTDNGWGIARKYQRKLFAQYYQVPRGDRSQKGYGIGLAYVRYIIQEHNGKIRVVSEENKGSTFSFTLPQS